MTKKRQPRNSIAELLKGIVPDRQPTVQERVNTAIRGMEHSVLTSITDQQFFENLLELQTTGRHPIVPAWLDNKTFTIRVDKDYPTMVFLELYVYDSASDMNDWSDFTAKQTIPMTITEFRRLVDWFSGFKKDFE